MAEAKRRGYGEDGIYFDHGGDCRDSAHHKTCTGRWRGVVSLGFDADGKRIRKKVSGQTRTEVKDKLKELHSELDAGVRTVQGYTVEGAVADWLAEGLPSRAAKTVEVYRDALRPLVAVIGRLSLVSRTSPARPLYERTSPALLSVPRTSRALTSEPRTSPARPSAERTSPALASSAHTLMMRSSPPDASRQGR